MPRVGRGTQVTTRIHILSSEYSRAASFRGVETLLEVREGRGVVWFLFCRRDHGRGARLFTHRLNEYWLHISMFQLLYQVLGIAKQSWRREPIVMIQGQGQWSGDDWYANSAHWHARVPYRVNEVGVMNMPESGEHRAPRQEWTVSLKTKGAVVREEGKKLRRKGEPGWKLTGGMGVPWAKEKWRPQGRDVPGGWGTSGQWHKTGWGRWSFPQSRI